MDALFIEVAAGVSTGAVLWSARWIIKVCKRVLVAAQALENLRPASQELSRAARRAELSAGKLGDVCTRLEVVAGNLEA